MDCYKCYFRGSIPGDAHSCCKFYGLKSDMFDYVMPENQIMSQVLNIKVNAYGMRNGWVMFPVNFDPRWIINCYGFLDKTNLSEGKDRFNKIYEVYKALDINTLETYKEKKIFEYIISNIKKVVDLIENNQRERII